MGNSDNRKIKVKSTDSQINQSGYKYDHLLFFSGLFIISVVYFIFFGSNIFFYQEQQGLFIYSADYFHNFTLKPGGLLQYAAAFITQGYYNTLTGSILLSAIITLTAFVFLQIIKKSGTAGSLKVMFAVIPSCLLLLCNTDFNFQLSNTLGYLLAAIYFLLLIRSESKTKIYILIILFPVFYYITGAFTWVLCGMYIVHSLLNKKLLLAIILLLIFFITLIFSHEILFLQTWNELLFNPMPDRGILRYFYMPYVLPVFVIIFPAFLKAASYLHVKDSNTRSLSVYTALFTLSVTIFLLSRMFNMQIENLFKLEKLFTRQEWDEVIRFQESRQLNNVVAEYYYNIALSEKDLLCERMFNTNQKFGTNSIMVQWDSRSNINQIFRGAYFFNAIGLNSEAHRWAFESMVGQGYRPENLKMLIKTELINGNLKIAGRYISVLGKTLNYRSFARKYRKMLDNPDLISNDPELGGKKKLLPKKDFLIRLKDQQDNILLLLNSNPDNRKAFEYKMAWYMLERNIDKICEEMNRFGAFGYKRLPRHIEETAVYFNSFTGKLPDLGGLKISNETISRFSSFKALSGQIGVTEDRIRDQFGKTYWYYLELQ